MLHSILTVRVRFCQRKLEDMKLEELHKAQLEEQRLAKLSELKEKTPYAQIIANITVLRVKLMEF